jgi:hypothetical protein
MVAVNEKFDEQLGNLLANCRENVIDELRFNKRYAELEQAQSALRVELEAVSSEVKTLAEKYFDAVVGVHSMECNAALLFGLTFASELRKRCDTSTPEYQAFVKVYME